MLGVLNHHVILLEHWSDSRGLAGPCLNSVNNAALLAYRLTSLVRHGHSMLGVALGHLEGRLLRLVRRHVEEVIVLQLDRLALFVRPPGAIDLDGLRGVATGALLLLHLESLVRVVLRHLGVLLLENLPLLLYELCSHLEHLRI